MFGPPPLINFIRQFLKLPDNLWKVFHNDIYYGIPCLFLFLWTCFVIDTHRGSQPLSWSILFISWLWRCDSHLVQTAKLWRDVQGGVLITILDISVFPNIATTTIFHVNSCELTKCELFLTCEIFLLERLPSGATMINRRWCYNSSRSFMLIITSV